MFNTKRNLKKHVRQSHVKLICPYCSKLCTKAHIYSAHKEEPMQCDICSQVLRNKDALRGHKRKVHSEKGVFPCQECAQVNKSSMNANVCPSCTKFLKPLNSMLPHNTSLDRI